MYEDLDCTGDGEEQSRGRKFETVIAHLLEVDGLRPELGVTYRGEQCDISFIHHHQHFLLEAKWHDKPIQAHHIFSFRSKLEGKLVGTLGVFLSISGYTDDAFEAVTFGRSINTILFDASDWEYAIQDEHAFSAILEVKLRRAAAYEDINYSYQTYLDMKGLVR